jgi:hypothetical protein
MKRIRLRTVAVFSLAVLTGGLLLRTSQSVQKAEEKLDQLKISVQQEQDSIRLLDAEWAYLNNPERLEKLSRQYLDLMPPQPAAMISEPAEIPAKLDAAPSSTPLSPQPVSLQSQPPKKSPGTNLTSLLKNIGKGGAH